MHHHVIYWRMARADVDDAELAALLHLERRSEAYVKFLEPDLGPSMPDSHRGG